LFLRLLKTESGYSLLEVIVAILLLAVAIIPMVGMFDAGLRAATQGSDYDKAWALANKQLETAKSLPYEDVRDDFPVGSSTPDTGTGVYASSDQTDEDFPGFTYTVRKAYVRLGTTDIAEDASARTMMRVTVTVDWGNGKSYGTTGLVSK
jgi:prepilin-type N-terminal cleavage/methylation domain-containing protein